MAIDQPNQDPQAEEAPRNLTAEAKAILTREDATAAAAFLQEVRTADRLGELTNVLLARLRNLANQAIPIEIAHIKGRHPFPTPYRAPITRDTEPIEELTLPPSRPWSANLGFKSNPVWAGLHPSNVDRLARRGVRGK